MQRVDSFMVSATEPRKYPSGIHNVTIRCGIVAVDIVDAITTFKRAHPDATFWTVSHRGQIEVITSDAMEAAAAKAADKTEE